MFCCLLRNLRFRMIFVKEDIIIRFQIYVTNCLEIVLLIGVCSSTSKPNSVLFLIPTIVNVILFIILLFPFSLSLSGANKQVYCRYIVVRVSIVSYFNNNRISTMTNINILEMVNFFWSYFRMAQVYGYLFQVLMIDWCVHCMYCNLRSHINVCLESGLSVNF